MNTIVKTAVQQPIKRVLGRLEAPDGTMYLPSDNLVSMKLTATGQPLATSMAQLEATILGEHKLLDTRLTASMGVHDGTDYVYEPLGDFLVLKAEYSKDEDVTKLTAYDNMVQFQKPYTSIANFPTTLQDYLASLCAGVGVKLATTTLYNGTLAMPEDYWITIPGITFRDVLKEICEVSATSARINANGELEMVDLPSATGEELTYANLLEYDFSDEYGAINTVVASRQPQNDDVVMQDDAQVNLAMTRNLLDLETAQRTYTMEEA